MKKQRITGVIFLLLLLSALLAGCGQGESTDDGITYFHHSIAGQQDDDTQAEATEAEQTDDYLVTAVDQIQESLQLYRYENGMEYRYYYGTGTRFYDRYGNRTTVSSFTQGTLVSLGAVSEEGILCEVQISDDAWVYDDVTRFSVDDEIGMLKIADTKYRYDDETYVFSGENTVAMNDLAKGDTISVVGTGKKILAVRITTSQGTVALTNTSLFEGSFVQIGTKIFAEITEDMEISVTEGTYDLTVANNGWGGTQEITVVRGETTTVDLDKLKGKGPSNGKIQFVIDVEDAVLMIDGKEVDYEDPVTLTYGSHSLSVYATGYDVWQRKLYVNSKQATIVISLSDEDDDDDEEDSSTTIDTTPSESTSSESSTESDSQSESEKRQEELELIQDLVTSLTSASSILSN